MPHVELDKIYNADSRSMHEVDDGSVQLIVTSPPYNVGKDYAQHEDAMNWDVYLDYLNETWKECVRVLCHGGRIAVNVANTWRKPYIPLNSYVAKQLTNLGLMMRGEIIWDKGPSVGISTAWGSFAQASNPSLRDVHEYIVVFSKQSWKLEETHSNRSGIENLEFVEWTKSVWRSPQTEIEDAQNSIWQFETQGKKSQLPHWARPQNGEHPSKHPAVFPLDLPLRLILLYTNAGDIVLDPFIGSGTTAMAARMTQRHYIGYELSPDYCALAEKRIATFDYPPFMEERLARPKKRRTRRKKSEMLEKKK